MSGNNVARQAAHEWFTIAPRYRTKERLAAHIAEAINRSQIVDEHNGGIEDNGSLDVIALSRVGFPR